MERLKELSDALTKINKILKAAPTKDHLQYEIQDMVEVLLNSCIMIISMTYLKARSEGVAYDYWYRQSNSFGDFLELYGEFCSHVIHKHMNDMEVDEMFIEVNTKLKKM